jgi:predicted phosphodiesterase
MRVALVSDIHGNRPALLAVAAMIEATGAELVLNLGDIASGPLWPRETVAWLAERAWPTIAGNHERQALAAAPSLQAGDGDDAYTAAKLGPAERAWLAALPASMRACEGEIQAFHGIPGDDLQGLLETVVPGYAARIHPGVRAATDDEIDARLAGLRAPVLVCGHTHTPRLRRLADGTLAVNPGSVGRPAYAHDQPHRHIVECGTPHARWALLERRADGWHAELHQTAYDWNGAARRAAAQGFADWAYELGTGRARPGGFR